MPNIPENFKPIQTQNPSNFKAYYLIQECTGKPIPRIHVNDIKMLTGQTHPNAWVSKTNHIRPQIDKNDVKEIQLKTQNENTNIGYEVRVSLETDIINMSKTVHTQNNHELLVISSPREQLAKPRLIWSLPWNEM